MTTARRESAGPCRAVYFDRPVPYAEGIRLQESLLAARQADRIPDTVLFLQHRPVVTLGRRGRDNFLLLSAEDFARRGIDVHHASRGGDVTWHGPGQWVVYPILRLGGSEADAHGYLANLEEVAIRTCADFGVPAFRRAGKSGAWIAQGKIAAIGFVLKRWVSMHGTSFNVDCELDGFSTIVPCGLAGEPVASLKIALGAACPSREAVRDRLAANFATVCQRPLDIFRPGDHLPGALAELFP